MKIETILNAMEAAYDDYIVMGHVNHKRMRQYRAFRDRILRMDAEKDARIKEMEDIYILHQIRMGLIEKDWDTPEENDAWKDL